MLTQTTSRAGSFKQPAVAFRQAPHAGKDRPTGTIELMGALVPFPRNTEIYGENEPADYLKVGGPLNLLWWILATALIPVFWPLRVGS